MLSGLYACNNNPVALAQQYCNCRGEVEAGKKAEGDCKDMAESHFLKLQDEPEQLKKYTDKVMDCISMDTIQQP